jgi:hypothetical protein
VWGLLQAPHFWVVQIWIAMVVLVFCTFRELIRAMGPGQVRDLFVGTLPHAPRGSTTEPPGTLSGVP